MNVEKLIVGNMIIYGSEENLKPFKKKYPASNNNENSQDNSNKLNLT